MPTDSKYGQVTLEKGNVPDDEPVFVLRGRDTTIGATLGQYWNLCKEAGAPQHHLDLISQTAREIEQWQAAYPDRVQVPASASTALGESKMPPIPQPEPNPEEPTPPEAVE